MTSLMRTRKPSRTSKSIDGSEEQLGMSAYPSTPVTFLSMFNSL